MPAKKRANLYMQSLSEAQQQEAGTQLEKEQDTAEAHGTTPVGPEPSQAFPSPQAPPMPPAASPSSQAIKMTIYLTPEQAKRVDGYIQAFYEQTGIRPNRNDIIRRLIDLSTEEDILPQGKAK
jgi:hypothetical protein